MNRIPLLAAAMAFATLSACNPPSDPDQRDTAATPSPGTIEAAPPATPATPTATDAPPQANGDDPCGATKVAPWIGKPSTIPVRRAVVEAANPAADRWIYPDSVVTQDYRPDRLNVVMEKGSDVIVSAHCG